MGKSWDDDKGGRKQWIAWMSEVMSECMRVMKPGAHGLVWAIPRTSHWTATALEDAGFEIRDVVTHLFGSGFPKSLDISKAMDKAAGAEREAKPLIDPNGRVYHQKEQSMGEFNACKVRQNFPNAVTDLAKEWQGWGTALKPASEHWILVRKPISEKTVAKNVEKWGVGGLNIDGCRIETDELKNKVYNNSGKDLSWGGTYGKGTVQGNHIGRFPANLVLSHSPLCTEDACDMFECPVKQLDEQSGTLKSGSHTNITTRKNNGNSMGKPTGVRGLRHGDSGGASRFFYVAKPSRREKNAGTDMSQAKAIGARPKSGDMTGKFPDHDQRERVGNFHPTVKPIKLMRYLIRMITPKGGVVLDPFTGSGTTGVAALQEGMRFLGVEREADYVAIAEKRIEAVS